MEMMRKALECCQSPIYRVERALERERSSDRDRISEWERHGSRREWSPTQEILVLALCTQWGGSTLTRANGGYGFTSIKWRQQGCCQTATVRKQQCGRKQTFISAWSSNQRNMSLFSTPLEGRICRAMWKMTSGDDNLQTKGEKRETHQRDNGKWPLWQKQMMKIERRNRGVETDLQQYELQGRNKASDGHWRCFVLLPVQHWHQNAISSTRGQTYANHSVSQSVDLSEELPHLPILAWAILRNSTQIEAHAVLLQVKAGVPAAELTALNTVLQ